MRKRLIFLIIAYSFLMTGIVGCSANVVPTDVENYYMDFIDAAKNGTFEDFVSFVHYENTDHLNYAEESYIQLEQCEIERWKQLSADLWVVEIKVMMEGESTMQGGFYFVGVVNGEYRVMLNARNVPEALRNGLDLSEYLNPDALDVDDLR